MDFSEGIVLSPAAGGCEWGAVGGEMRRRPATAALLRDGQLQRGKERVVVVGAVGQDSPALEGRGGHSGASDSSAAVT